MFSSLVFERSPKSANDNAAGSIIGGPFHLIIDIEDELRHVVVPIERNNGLRGKPAAVTHIERSRRRCREIISVVENRQEDFASGMIRSAIRPDNPAIAGSSP